ncbi:MAG: DEAD/DEAH box helicase family protein [Prevotellaceae bacterium]|nr:DEAD/DEAH box helicase family protein [Prevotellaceae bacterium]
MLIDNKTNRYPDSGFSIVTVWDFIKEFAGSQSNQTGNIDIVTGYFTIRALSKLYHELPEKDEFRIVSSEMVMQEEDKNHIIDLLNGDMGIDTTLNLDAYARDAKAFLQRNTVQVKAIFNAFCHAKAYMFRNDNPRNDSFYLTGSSNLTDAGLGLKATSNIELTMGDPVKLSDKDYQEVCSWFEDIWKMAADKIPSDPGNPKSEKISVKDYFIKKIDDYFRRYTPEEIYYKILFELFNSDIELDGSIEHRQDMSLLQTSEIWKTLFKYQQQGVISLIKMLRKYNGAILADAVGLGKTFSALAVIKYFQTQNYVTVLLCPKKLEQNWTQYLKRHGSRFDKDEFDYIVRFHTDLQNDRLQNAYDDAPLSWLQSRKKVLVVIDESHNLRNEKSGRYQELLSKLIQNRTPDSGRDVKVLMLSATPINTGLNDVKGQFNLIGHGNDTAFDTEDFNIESLKNLFADSQRKYTQWCNDPDRTIGSFISLLPPKFFNLTDKLIVARTRKLIENTLGEDLGFPNKEKPDNVYQGVDHFGKYRSTDEIYAAFDALSLTAYQPSLFLPATRKEAEKEASNEWNDNVNRERFLVKMMGILFMKRLESSWHSCHTTVQKVLEVHEQTLAKVVAFKERKASGRVEVEIPDDDENNDTDDLFTLRKGTINLADMKNLGGFERGLRMDVNKLRAICESLDAFAEDYKNGLEEDLKLERLVSILEEKKKSPNRKVVIFTAYADTAKFIFDELRRRGFSRMVSVSGQEIHSTGSHNTANFNEVLQSFAPYSKLYKEKDWSDLFEEASLNRSEYYDDDKRRWNVPYSLWLRLINERSPSFKRLLDDGIDILIATDCLSEGQNLQDADMQINYDIHWNPVRLIQRFGRIDRIGSPNKSIRCVNFWPAKSFEDYLHLETRIMNRMVAMNLVGSETQQLNEAYLKMEADNPLQDKNADRLLEELQNNSISDIESPRTLSLKDFSFEVYRQDLIDYFEKHKEVFRRMPNGIFSGFKLENDLFEQIPESLVAVVGYPHREQGSKKAYSEIYLICQPADTKLPATYKELNRAEVLDLLRRNKNKERFVPEWIEGNDKERLQRLSDIIRLWMDSKVPQQATAAILQIAQSRKSVHQLPNLEKNARLLEEKFRKENFDLIVWEYVSKDNNQ